MEPKDLAHLWDDHDATEFADKELPENASTRIRRQY
jgi:hypothetical protein